MTLETISQCPICLSNSFIPFINTKDHTVSQQDFNLQKCSGCGFVITNPRPDINSIGDFYKSDKYISHTGGSKTIIDKIYLQARKLTLRRKHKLITNYKNSGHLLDFGCGTGEFLNHMQKNGWEITGVEPSDSARKKANEITKSFINSSLIEIDRKFDIITLWHVLEHVHDLNEKIKSLKNLLKEDGIIFIAVPNHESADAQHYKNNWAGYDVPRHIWHFSKSNMHQLLQNHGLTLAKTEPMKLDSFYVSLLSESYKTKKNLPTRIFNAVMNGIKSNASASKTGMYSSLIYIVTHK